MSAPSYDFIVVGAGSAGAALANRLVTGSDATVLLIEAGGRDSRPEIHDEKVPSTISLWGPSEIDWGYVTAPQPALHGRTVPIARGKVWGGSSSINAMLYVRGHRMDYDNWAALGNHGWGYRDVLPYFKRLEDFEGGQSEYRGTGGPIGVLYHADPSPVSTRLFAAGGEVGLKDQGPRFDYNAGEQEETVFYYQTSKTPDHHRSSTATGYLHPLLENPGLTIASEALASRVLIRNERAVGVEYVAGGAIQQAYASTEVIVCGGAFNSPHLLKLSGIGPAAELRGHGIDVVADLPGVGRNLQDHMVVGVCYLAREEPPFVPTLIAETGFFTRTSATPADRPPDLQMAFGGIKFVSPAYDREGPGFTFAPIIIQPRSTGTVTLRSADPSELPIVDPNYLSDPADVECFLEAIELSRALAATSAISGLVKEEIAPGPTVTGRAELAEYVRENAGTLWHPTGTCRMGDDEESVVDDRLRVHGVEGLRVADASIMPQIVAGNTNAPCIMIGEKAADLLLGRTESP
ncbi:GMC oxidoreductase [Sphaerisporangium siamense]|uniref:Choline dehydrogenase n=1 Tax=Sphaerisporangium siamense TaxID=795645 RepID=A0A7W7D7D0_9ACTN|nr:GMC family oxidoreductase N-terminal domain-containing protein [Sphaerisporangium siamense]MBB4700326.1 choline dehydrogenase [Sphaerisporangium siamense]GII87742.1 GMC oxidoreductase [Sphaerisporangium siamense]